MGKEESCPQDDNLFRAFMSAIYNTIDAPVTYFRGKTKVYKPFCYVSAYVHNLLLLCYREGCGAEPDEVPVVPPEVPPRADHRPMLRR